MNNLYLYDQQFLQKLALQKNKEISARITLLDLKENPIESLEGRISAGSINLTGTSAISRTCSLTLISEEVGINKFMWTQKTKFKLEIGLKNTINDQYPEVCWFKQGIFLITTFSMSIATNNCTVSIQGIDKMAMLNGTCGGILQTSIDFGREEIEDGSYVKIPIERIIREAVHTYALEPYSNIIINNIDEFGLDLIQYVGDKDIYLISKNNGDNFFTSNETTVCFNGKVKYTPEDDEAEGVEINIYELPEEAFSLLFDLNYENQIQEQGKITSTSLTDTELKPIELKVAKITGGQHEAIGYQKTDLVYAGELVGNVGDNIANAVLNKITQQMPSFEYFYNVDGQFVFQKKKEYITAAGFIDQGKEITNILEPSFLFQNSELITNYSLAPNIKDIKNDFAIWGNKIINDSNIPIYSRYAIDKKPTYYKTPWPYSDYGIAKAFISEWKDKAYYQLGSNDYVIISENDWKDLPDDTLIYINYKELNINEGIFSIENGYEWRQILYEMAKDYMKFHTEDNFLQKIKSHNPQYIGGQTGYEQYYADIIKFFQEGPIKEKMKVNYALDRLHPAAINQQRPIEEMQNYFNKYCIRAKDFPNEFEQSEEEPIIGGNYLFFYFLKHKKMIDILNTAENFVTDKDYFNIIYTNEKNEEITVYSGSLQDENNFFEFFNKDPVLNKYKVQNKIDTNFITLEQLFKKIFTQLKNNEDMGYDFETLIKKLCKQHELNSNFYLYAYSFRKEGEDMIEKIDINIKEMLMGKKKALFGNIKNIINFSIKIEFFSLFFQKIIIDSPENITCWFDFQEPHGDLEQFSVKAIGQKLYAKNDNNLKVIDYKRIPNIIYVNIEENPKAYNDLDISSYSINNIPSIYQNYFGNSSRGISIQERIDELLNQYTYPMNTITFTCLPVYWLQPNDIIYISEPALQINGKYIISSVSIPLQHNGTTSITATKLMEE